MKPKRKTFLRKMDPALLNAVVVPPGMRSAPRRAYRDRRNGWVVQVWDDRTPGCDGTPWAGTLLVGVKHTRAMRAADLLNPDFSLPITWEDLQALKDYFWPKRIAIEVFPPRHRIVDVAGMRWIWVLPEGARLPFDLKHNSRCLS